MNKPIRLIIIMFIIWAGIFFFIDHGLDDDVFQQDATLLDES